MTDLKSHVDSIVNPLRATQSRKLRLRRELLTHLQSAHAEELALNPDDALARATHRLGDPAAITAQLQQTVPALERLLLSRLPTPPAYDRWESTAASRVWGIHRPLTLPHAGLVLAAAVVLPYAASLTLVLLAGHPSTYLAHLVNHPLATLLYDLCLLGSTLTLIVTSLRFITAAAAGRRTLPHLAIITACLTLTLLTSVLGLAHRPLMPTDFATLAITLTLLLPTLHLTVRLLAHLQRPYQDWLSTDPVH